MIAGLTGGISTGKSTASSYLKNTFGAYIIDCDLIARQVVMPGTAGYREIVKYFGPSILCETNTSSTKPPIDRKKLGSLIFGGSSEQKTKRKKLNSITHPKIRKIIFTQVIKGWINFYPLIIIDAPLLFESGLHKVMPTTLLITASPATQLHRLMHRDKIGRQEAFDKITSQMLLSEKQKLSSHTIWNNSDFAEFQTHLDIWAKPLIFKGRIIQIIFIILSLVLFLYLVGVL